ncbi:MAG: EAL domain-containing protein, partial [Chromatiaceae bacterium]|nr:EAL domain-containing protein [Chromatiaceae bacterium]
EYVNRTLLRLWALDETAIRPGDPVGNLWERPEALDGIAEWLEHHAEWHGALTARLGNGALKRLHVVAEPSWRVDGAARGYTLACLDSRSLRTGQGASSDQILAMADVAVLAVNARGLIIEANRRACDLFGYSSEEMLGLLVHELVPPQFRQRHVEQVQTFFRDAESAAPHLGRRAEISGYRKDGAPFPAEISISRCTIEGEAAMVITLRDITERKIAEDELIWRATHDELTGLPNRALIHERLTRALQRSRRQGHNVALLFIDLDGFKLINDSHGHSVGDALLKNLAHRLIIRVRPGDTVGRLGGDEFVVLCDQVESPNAMATLADRLTDLLREPVELQGHHLFATASIGVAIGHGTTHNADDMLRDADAAMYNAKEQGRDGWRFFSEEIHEQARKRLDITNGLRLAIERGELQVRFQPILGTESQLIRGAELLIRWIPREGEISPAHFIPIAEMSGSIVPIGKWVFREACRAEAGWRARFGEQAPYVSVNVSARQLNDASLVESCRDSLLEFKADPKRIVLELTETSLMSDVIFNLSVLKQLADLGLRVAVDDFGTGYSSLAQLLRLPVSTLKIDREFVDGLDKRHDSRAIVSAVCSMARAMDLQVIAEGVENEPQFQYLRGMGCDYVQGFYFHRPLPA